MNSINLIDCKPISWSIAKPQNSCVVAMKLIDLESGKIEIFIANNVYDHFYARFIFFNFI